MGPPLPRPCVLAALSNQTVFGGRALRMTLAACPIETIFHLIRYHFGIIYFYNQPIIGEEHRSCQVARAAPTRIEGLACCAIIT